MKKIFSLLAITIFAFSFSQQNKTSIEIKTDKDKIEKVYSKGFEKFKNDLANNLQYTANSFQVLGDFKVNFTINENGKISDVKVFPELFDKSFENEVKRDVSRMQKHFSSNQKENISINLSFSRGYRDFNERVQFAYYSR